MEKINYLALGITLFLALTCSRLFSDWLEWKIAEANIRITAEKLQEKIQADLKINRQREETESRNRAVRDAEIKRQQESYQAEQRRIGNANRIRNENAAEAQRIMMETCQFWIAEFNKTKAEGDKNHRNNACKDAGTKFN